MGGNEIKYIEKAFKENCIALLGPNVTAFENEVAEYLGVKAGAAVSSGTAALHLVLDIIGIKEGDIVFCSDLTFIASCNPIIYLGGTPVFIDSSRDSLNMSIMALEKAIKKAKEERKIPKAIIVVNLYGQSADFDSIRKICEKEKIIIIEDAAESFGASYKNKKSGTLGDFSIISFNGNKIITTSGGGIVLSNNEEAIKKVRFLSTQAKEAERYYEHKERGYNYRMSNITGAIGRGQLEILNERVEKKREIFRLYKEQLKDVKDIEMVEEMDYGKSNYWLSIMLIEKNSRVKPLDIILELEKNNIEGRHIWKPMHMQPCFKNIEFFSENDNGTSISEEIFNQGICLPSDSKMSREEQLFVIKVIKDLFKKF
ncbi:MAG: DegT/DnrJ/EryC1/StrS family aminotransferase [Sarcina sp.]